MNIRDALQREHSKAVAEEVAQYALRDKAHFDGLMQIFFSEENHLVQRAAWSVSKIAERHPEWLLDYLPQLIQSLEKPVHPAVSRNIYRSLQKAEIPEDYEAALLDLCLRDLLDFGQPVGVKVFAMTVAANIAGNYPELKQELRLAIEQNLEGTSAGYHSRARKILPRLQ